MEHIRTKPLTLYLDHLTSAFVACIANLGEVSGHNVSERDILNFVSASIEHPQNRAQTQS